MYLHLLMEPEQLPVLELQLVLEQKLLVQKKHLFLQPVHHMLCH